MRFLHFYKPQDKTQVMKAARAKGTVMQRGRDGEEEEIRRRAPLL